MLLSKIFRLWADKAKDLKNKLAGCGNLVKFFFTLEKSLADRDDRLQIAAVFGGSNGVLRIGQVRKIPFGSSKDLGPTPLPLRGAKQGFDGAPCSVYAKWGVP
jgi:hypothetical protein